MVIFFRLFLIFSKTVFCKRLGFFHCVQCIRTLFWALRNSFLAIFPIFHHKGGPGPVWFKMSQKLKTLPNMAKNLKLKYFCEQNYKWIRDPDGTTCLKDWIKIRITLIQQLQLLLYLIIHSLLKRINLDQTCHPLWWSFPNAKSLNLLLFFLLD